MDVVLFKADLMNTHPPENISVYVKALWYDGKGNWEKAHIMAQDLDDKVACWIHAYLHRKENDLANADYWYPRAGRQRTSVSLEKEGEQLVAALS